MNDKQFDVVAHVRGLVGLIVGAVTGYFLFHWLVGQGFYALALPGALMGLACGYASRIHSPALAVVCGLTAAVLLIVFEWKELPFIADKSFSYFLSHLHQLKPLTLIMLALGIVFAAWFGLGRPKA